MIACAVVLMKVIRESGGKPQGPILNHPGTNVLECVDLNSGIALWKHTVYTGSTFIPRVCTDGVQLVASSVQGPIEMFFDLSTGSPSSFPFRTILCATNLGRIYRPQEMSEDNWKPTVRMGELRQLEPMAGFRGNWGVQVWSDPEGQIHYSPLGHLKGFQEGSDRVAWDLDFHKLGLPKGRPCERIDAILVGENVYCYTAGILFKIDALNGTVLARFDALKNGFDGPVWIEGELQSNRVTLIPYMDSIVVLTQHSLFKIDRALAKVQWQDEVYLEFHGTPSPVVFEEKLYLIRGLGPGE